MSVIDEVVNDLCSKLAQRSIQEVKKAREKQIQEAGLSFPPFSLTSPLPPFPSFSLTSPLPLFPSLFFVSPSLQHLTPQSFALSLSLLPSLFFPLLVYYQFLLTFLHPLLVSSHFPLFSPPSSLLPTPSRFPNYLLVPHYSPSPLPSPFPLSPFLLP